MLLLLQMNHGLTRVLRVLDGTAGSHTAAVRQGVFTTSVCNLCCYDCITLVAILIAFAAVFYYADETTLLLAPTISELRALLSM